MGFFTWLVLILILAFVLFAAFSWMLNWFYPAIEETSEETDLAQRRRKWIGMFVLVAAIVLTAMTGINAFLGAQA